MIYFVRYICACMKSWLVIEIKYGGKAIKKVNESFIFLQQISSKLHLKFVKTFSGYLEVSWSVFGGFLVSIFLYLHWIPENIDQKTPNTDTSHAVLIESAKREGKEFIQKILRAGTLITFDCIECTFSQHYAALRKWAYCWKKGSVNLC